MSPSVFVSVLVSMFSLKQISVFQLLGFVRYCEDISSHSILPKDESGFETNICFLSIFMFSFPFSRRDLVGIFTTVVTKLSSVFPV